MKVIKYQKMSRYNVGTDENPDWREGLGMCIMGYNEANLKLAKQEAYNGEYTIEEIPDADPEDPSGDASAMWDELDAAYQEGVDSV